MSNHLHRNINSEISEVTSSQTQPVVYELREKDAERWARFVTEHPEANLYHTLLWRDIIQEIFGHQPIYLLCESEGKIRGVLPMFLVRFPFLGSKLISIPYDIGSGGALVIDEASELALVEQAIKLAQEMQVNYLELRYGSSRPALAQFHLVQSQPVLISEMELESEEQVLAGLKEDHRKAIRKAQNRGVIVREAKSLEDFHTFYRIYLQVFRDFGTPPYGSGYFPTLWRRLHGSRSVRLLLAYVQQRCVGGLLLFCWGKNLVSKFAACLPEAVPLRAYVALYWRAIQLGLELGYRKLSWGTSSRNQTGLVEFKERWGARTRPAMLYHLPMRGKIPSLEKYYDSQGLTRQLWRKLPLKVTPSIGGLINRWFC
jgi:FemAB-related protein (PEP-CTERM system-associated)